MAPTLSPLHLKVRTAAGQHLGQVVDLEIDPATQQVRCFHVKLSRLIPALVQSPLLIQSSQVIEITDTEIVVDNNTAAEPGAVPEPSV